MYNNYNCPLGADDNKAPWNTEELPERELEVLVSISLSKSVKIKVSDYVVNRGVDEDESYYEEIDYSECDLKKAIEAQKILPHHAGSILQGVKDCTISLNRSIIEDLKDWNVDEMEVMIE